MSAVLLVTSFGDIVIALDSSSCESSDLSCRFLKNLSLLHEQKLLRLEKDYSCVFPFASSLSPVPGPLLGAGRDAVEGSVFLSAQGLVFALGRGVSGLAVKFPLLGRVVEGLDVVRRINREVVTDLDGRPIARETSGKNPVIEGVFDVSLVPEMGYNTSEIRRVCGKQELALHAEEMKDKETENREKVLFVCRLSPFTDEEDLKVIFSRFGIVEKANLIRDSETSESLKYGFIEFASKNACESAYKHMQNAIIDNKHIAVDFAHGGAGSR
jgi:hypothetical protein